MIEYVLLSESGVVWQRGTCSSPEEIPQLEGLTAEIVGRDDKRVPNPRPEASYADERRMAYPGIGEQLDALWKAVGPLLEHPEANAILARIQEVKKAHPKPTNTQ